MARASSASRFLLVRHARAELLLTKHLSKGNRIVVRIITNDVPDLVVRFELAIYVSTTNSTISWILPFLLSFFFYSPESVRHRQPPSVYPSGQHRTNGP